LPAGNVPGPFKAGPIINLAGTFTTTHTAADGGWPFVVSLQDCFLKDYMRPNLFRTLLPFSHFL